MSGHSSEPTNQLFIAQLRSTVVFDLICVQQVAEEVMAFFFYLRCPSRIYHLHYVGLPSYIRTSS